MVSTQSPMRSSEREAVEGGAMSAAARESKTPEQKSAEGLGEKVDGWVMEPPEWKWAAAHERLSLENRLAGKKSDALSNG